MRQEMAIAEVGHGLKDTVRAQEYDLLIHMDGARLLNAVAALGTPASLFSSCADSVWIAFTKGLGTLVGAVSAGSQEFIDGAKPHRHFVRFKFIFSIHTSSQK